MMHDILEGSLQYEVKELLKHFIHTQKYFTLDTLNKSISEFPYVLSDKATRPAMIFPTVISPTPQLSTVKTAIMGTHFFF